MDYVISVPKTRIKFRHTQEELLLHNTVVTSGNGTSVWQKGIYTSQCLSALEFNILF
jgi:hypothetical protein